MDEFWASFSRENPFELMLCTLSLMEPFVHALNYIGRGRGHKTTIQSQQA